MFSCFLIFSVDSSLTFLDRRDMMGQYTSQGSGCWIFTSCLFIFVPWCCQICISRPDISQKFGMMIVSRLHAAILGWYFALTASQGGIAITSIHKLVCVRSSTNEAADCVVRLASIFKSQADLQALGSTAAHVTLFRYTPHASRRMESDYSTFLING